MTYQLTVVDSAFQPQSFSLVYPSDNSVLTGTLESFWWNSSANANSYSLQITSDSSFTTIDTLIEMISASSYEFDLSSLSLGEYYWRVIAYNVCNDSVISATRSFTIFDLIAVAGLELWLDAGVGLDTTGNN
ncbi:MAG TPA: hypothetical protein EYN51_11095, partial [Flavobacteriales bacterium]|nr:hypothetical protein [Flavobacteriales bacterium]